MKKLMLVVIVLSAFSFASCKKDHNCVCKSGSIQVASTVSHNTKKKVNDECSALEESYRNKGADVTCGLE
jgi:hypothetical protein